MRLGLSVVLILGIPFCLAAWFSSMPGESHQGTIPPLTKQEQAVRDHLRRHVEALARRIGERSYRVPGSLREASEYVAGQLEDVGLQVRYQEYQAAGASFRNVETEIQGQARPDEIVLIGAHYDSVEGTSGADDNATGSAALIEIARLLRSRRPARTIRLVAFVNEEPPFFRTEDMGSHRYAARCRANGDDIVAMFSLECLGYYDRTPGSQKLPPPFGLLYPDQGDFVAFVGNVRNRGLTRHAIELFRETTPFPSEGVSAPALISGVDWSDHSSFWEHGYPGVMVTDTAFLRNPYYHQSREPLDSIQFEHLARITVGLAGVFETLANE